MERLKIQANFAISPTEIMRVQRLLQEQPALLLSPKGRASLKLLLAPLLCRNEAEQQQFYQIYEDYLSKDLQLSQPEIDQQAALTDLETAKEIPQSWLKKWLPLIASLLFGLLTIGVLVYRWMNPPEHTITFEKQQKEVRVGDTLVLKNSTDTLNTPFHFHWHCMDSNGKDTMHRHQDHDLTWLIPDPKGDFIKKIYLHAHHPETAEPIGVDSTEITILCNTLKVGSISVADTALIPNQSLPFSVEVENTENLQYQWDFGDGTTSEEIAPVHAYTAAGNYTVQVTIKDTINTVGKCEATVPTLIKIEPEVPDDPIVLNSFQLLEEPPIITHPLKPWYWPLLLLLLSAAAYCWWKWWHRPDPNQLAEKAQDIALKNRFAAPDKNPYSIPFAPAENKIQVDKSQFEIAHSLRNRQRGNRQTLDIEATLNSTVEQGGFPSVQYKYSSRPTDYLVLIDLQSAESHLARLFQYLATMLQDQDVLLDIFYYQKDFQHCWNARHSKGIDLAQLHRLYPQQRLIIMGDAHALVEQVSDNQLLNPIWERQLRKWNERILLTPLPIVSWTFLEARLYRLFALFPADLLGIMQAVRFMEAGAAEEDLPTTLKEWEIQLQKSQVEEDTIRRWRTVAQHEAYLTDHPEVLRWLKALVVYPNPTWNVTIAIGKALGVPVTYDNLLLLARIPWLQDGNFKVRLWRTFWKDLSKADEKLARNAVKEELEAVRKQTANAFAGRNLEQNLAIQNFALAPAAAENQAVIQYLEAEGLLPKLHLEELDKVIERHIPTYRNGEETGQTLSYYLADTETERNKKLERPIYTHHFWWGLALGLLSLLTAASYLVQGAHPHRQSIEKDISEAARLNNLAVSYMSTNLPINLEQLTDAKDSLDINGFDYKSTAALNLLKEATSLDTTFEKAHHNFQKQWYNDGISHYQEYLRDKNYDLQVAKPFLKRAIAYRSMNADSISHAAMYALANVHHILEEADSVCLFLDSLLKVEGAPFFNAIPNLDTKAAYCQEEVTITLNDSLEIDIVFESPDACIENGCEANKQWKVTIATPIENLFLNTFSLVGENGISEVSSTKNTINLRVTNGQIYYPQVNLIYGDKEIQRDGKEVTFKDCEPPIITTRPLSLEPIALDGILYINGKDFIQNYSDNCTVLDTLKRNLRLWHSSLGVDAPTRIEDIKKLEDNFIDFDCSYLGTQIFKCYVFDDSDNWGESTVNVRIMISDNSCDTIKSELVSGFIETPNRSQVFKDISKFIVLLNGEFAAISDNYITIFKLEYNNQVNILRAWEQEGTNITSLININGKELLVGNAQEQVAYLLNIETGERKRISIGQKLPDFYDIIFSNDGQLVVTRHSNQTIRISELQTGDLIRILKENTSYKYEVSFSPDGRYVVAAGADKTAIIWNLETGNQQYLLKEHKSPIVAAGYSNSGDYLLTRSLDNEVMLWNANGQLLQALKEWGRIIHAKFAPDDSSILISKVEEPARLWDVNGTLLHTFSKSTIDVRDANFTLKGNEIIFLDANGNFWKETFSIQPKKEKKIIIDEIDKIDSINDFDLNFDADSYFGDIAISYKLNLDSEVRLEVEKQGKKPFLLVNDFQSIGTHRVLWDKNIATGKYIIRLTVGQKVVSKTLNLKL